MPTTSAASGHKPATGQAFWRAEPSGSSPLPFGRDDDLLILHGIENHRPLSMEDHTFVDSDDNVVSGGDVVLEAWRSFFEAFPDYRNLWRISGSPATRS